MITVEDPVAWRRLAREYAALDALRNGLTRQARGQRFNGLIADLLRAHGIDDARANDRSVGEIDVIFTFGGRRFILEAKWEAKAISTDPIAKLQRRLEQRMQGVTGIVLSMSGYTKAALGEVDKGRRLDLVLLDRDHWEAMLSGFVPPQELLDLVTDEASFHGRAYRSLSDLLDQGETKEVPEVRFEPAPETPLRVSGDGVRGRVVLSDLPTPCGVPALDGEQGLLVALDRGILAVDPSTRRSRWAAPVSGCCGAVRSHDGAILVARAHGIGRHDRDRLTMSSTGTAVRDAAQLLPLAGRTVCLDAGAIVDPPVRPMLVEPGPSLGTEVWTELPTNPGEAMTVVRSAPNGTALVSGDREGWIVSDTGRSDGGLMPGGSATRVASMADALQVMVTRDLTIHVGDIRTGRVAQLGRIDAAGVDIRGVVGRDGGALVLVSYLLGNGARRAMVVELMIDPKRARKLLDEGGAAPRPPKASPSRPGPGQRGPVAPVTHATASVRVGHKAAARTAVASPVSAAPVSPNVTANSAVAARAAAEARAADERQGRRDGTAAAGEIPLYAVEELVSLHFDVIRWLEPWRQRWALIAGGTASPGTVLPEWVPALARPLGSCLAPVSMVEARLTPSREYLVGFADGLRGAWQAATARHLLPRHPAVLRAWLQQPAGDLSGPSRQPRHQQTIRDLAEAVSHRRRRTTRAWTGRVLLWLLTLILAFCALMILIGSSVSGEGPAQAVPANLLFDLPLNSLLPFVIADIWRLAKRAKTPRAGTLPAFR